MTMLVARLIFASLVLQLCATASAFNTGGHMVIGLIAHDQLEPADRSEVVRILRLHPRFDEHFLAKMPDSLRAAPQADQDRWVFAYAGVWCDVVKSNQLGQADRQRFNRGVWHYVNFPTFLNDRDRETMVGGLTVNLDTEPVGDDNFNWNIVQAFKNAQRVVSDPESSDEDKAVSLCWMFHLAGDSHQPLHSTALFTMGRFETGDRGGNEIKTEPGSNLHSVWDNMITGRGSPSKFSDFNDMRQRGQPCLRPSRLCQPQRCQLSGAKLHYASLIGANLSEANLDAAELHTTVLGNIDLSSTKNLESVHHLAPSTISVDTLYESHGGIPVSFLRGCGVPDNLIEYLPSLLAGPNPIQFYSCFISYSHADKSFARRLHDALQGQGIRCWLDEKQLLPGDDIHEEVDRGIRLWDKVLLCASEIIATAS